MRSNQAMDRILDFALADSRFSIGLQVADFFASMAYAHFRAGTPKGCGWWATLLESLDAKDGKIQGIGLKVFP